MKRYLILPLVLVAFLPPQSPAIADASLDSASSMLLGSRYKEAICEYEEIIYSEIDADLHRFRYARKKYSRAVAISDLVFVLMRSQASEKSDHESLEADRKRIDWSVIRACRQIMPEIGRAYARCLGGFSNDCPRWRRASEYCPRDEDHWKKVNEFNFESVDFGAIRRDVKIQSVSASVVEALQPLLQRELAQFERQLAQFPARPSWGDRDDSAFKRASSKIPRLCQIPKEEEQEYSD